MSKNFVQRFAARLNHTIKDVGTAVLPKNIFEQAKSGDVSSQKQLGQHYYKQIGSDLNRVSKGVAEAYLKDSIEWFSKAAAQGDEDSKYNLGVIHRLCFIKDIKAGESSRDDHYKKSREFFSAVKNEEEIKTLEMAKSMSEDRGR